MEKQYKCNFCKHEFVIDAVYVMGASEGIRQALSNQAQCPKCGNFMPTWEVKYLDGKKVKTRR